MQIVLTPAQLHLVASMCNGSVPSMPTPFRGWLADEIDRSLIQAGLLLVREELAVSHEGQILLNNLLIHLMNPVVHMQHGLFLQYSSNLDTSSFMGFYRGSSAESGTLIGRVGINTYALEEIPSEISARYFMQFIGIPAQVSYEPISAFQLSKLNVERILKQNPNAQQAVRAYDFSVVNGQHKQSFRVMYVRNQWWYVTDIGDECRFDPIDGRGLLSVIEQSLVSDLWVRV